MRGIILALFAVLALSACAVPSKSQWSSDEFVSRAIYRHNGPPRLTLFTMINNSNGSGAHTSLLINGSQRIAFDPAGSFRHEDIPARHDVVFGMTPYMVDVYTRFHARETFHVIVQQVDVSPEVAELALKKALSYGPVSRAHCAFSVSELLSELPGFGHIKKGYFPTKLSEQFAQIPGATFRRLYEDDDDDKSKVLRDFVPEKRLRVAANQ